MSVKTVIARLNALRKNLPDRDVNESVVRDFDSMVRELEQELPDPEITHFLIPEQDVKKKITSVAPGRGATYSRDRYCDRGVFRRQVEGLWGYLEDTGVVQPERLEPKRLTPHSQTINIHGHVTGSTIQQGDHNVASVNYQNEVKQALEEIRSVLNAAKLNPEEKQELRAEVETLEAQMKSPRPKHMIIRESLQSARHVLEHAFGAGLAHYFPQLLLFLEHHK